jgi:hypothetical protein
VHTHASHAQAVGPCSRHFSRGAAGRQVLSVRSHDSQPLTPEVNLPSIFAAPRACVDATRLAFAPVEPHTVAPRPTARNGTGVWSVCAHHVAARSETRARLPQPKILRECSRLTRVCNEAAPCWKAGPGVQSMRCLQRVAVSAAQRWPPNLHFFLEPTGYSRTLRENVRMHCLRGTNFWAARWKNFKVRGVQDELLTTRSGSSGRRSLFSPRLSSEHAGVSGRKRRSKFRTHGCRPAGGERRCMPLSASFKSILTEQTLCACVVCIVRQMSELRAPRTWQQMVFVVVIDSLVVRHPKWPAGPS